MASIAMLLGGAAVNALAFSGSNYLFSMLRSSGVDEERRRHDKAVQQLQAAHEQWSKQRTERLDWINEELCRQGHAVQTFHDVDMAIREYAESPGITLIPWGRSPKSLTSTRRAVTRKIARSPSLLWAWLRQA